MIYIDVSVLTLATFVTGIQRVTRFLGLLDCADWRVSLWYYGTT